MTLDMEKSEIISNCLSYSKSLFLSDSSGHDFDHTLRVYKMALSLQKKEGGDLFIISLASLLHDVDDYKLFSTSDFANARVFLKRQHIDSIEVERIIKIIDEVSFKGKESVTPSTIEGKIVQDADRLDALGAIGIARAFSYGGAHNRKLYDESEKINLNQSFEEYKRGSKSTITHFYEKLFLLEKMMNTKEAKRIAEKRTQYMREYIDEFLLEVNGEK